MLAIILNSNRIFNVLEMLAILLFMITFITNSCFHFVPLTKILKIFSKQFCPSLDFTFMAINNLQTSQNRSNLLK